MGRTRPRRPEQWTTGRGALRLLLRRVDHARMRAVAVPGPTETVQDGRLLPKFLSRRYLSLAAHGFFVGQGFFAAQGIYLFPFFDSSSLSLLSFLPNLLSSSWLPPLLIFVKNFNSRWLRCSSLKYSPIFSVVAPCHQGASPVSVRRHAFTTGC